jgi:PAS domain S-box-containing protein
MPESPWRIMKDRSFRIALISILTVITILLTVYCLSNGITIVFPHFYYIPIILASYWYRNRGMVYALGLGSFYLVAFFTLLTPGTTEIIAALARVMVFVVISAVIAYLSILIDREEQEIRRSEERFRAVWESIQAGIFLVDENTHRIVAANPEAEKLTGYTEAEMVGQICHRFICPAEAGRCPISDLGQTVEHAERVLINREGKKIPVLKSVRKMTIGNETRYVENVIDIRPIKDAENALIAYIRETALRIRNPVEIVRDDLADIMTRAGQDEISRESLVLELTVQQKNIEGILANLAELDTAIVEQRREIPDALAEYLRR